MDSDIDGDGAINVYKVKEERGSWE